AGRGEQGVDEGGGLLVQGRAGYQPVGQADADRLLGADPPAGDADVQGVGVADQVHQPLGAGQVGDQAEAGLGHGELRVVGDDPQVAGESELETGADGVALDHGDADQVGPAQPGEAGLEVGDVRLGVGPRSERGERPAGQAPAGQTGQV